MPIPQILVAGGVNLDTTYRVQAIPKVGETVSTIGNSQAFGGKGLNQALAIQRAGRQVGIIGAVGSDVAGEDIRTFLSTEGVATRFLVCLDGEDTGRALILVDNNADNTIVVDLGANLKADPGIIESIGDNWVDIHAVVANGEAPPAVVESLFREARERQITTVWNPSPMPANPAPLMRLTDTLVVNETEAAELAGKEGSPEYLANMLSAMGPKEIVITLGRKGSLVSSHGQVDRVATPRVEAVDPTAAGDTFLGYYVTARSNSQLPADSAAIASKAAALCVQVQGASNAIPTRDLVTAAEGEEL